MKSKFSLSYLFLFILLLNTKAIYSQSTTKFYQNYDWEKKPVLSTPNDANKTTDYYTVYEKRAFEYAYDSNNELCLYETKHVITHINTDKGVESKNKMYIPSGKIIEMVNLRARCINSSGKITTLSKDNVKQVDNLDDQGPFTIFAFEGVEPNCDIEVLYTAKKYISIYGSYFTQFSYPQEKLSIDFISPKNLIFEVKGYNGLSKFVADTSNSAVNHMVSTTTNIEPYEEEKYSAYDANKMRFDFHLRYNTYKSKSKMYTWSLIGNDLTQNYTNFEKDDIKAIQKMIDKSGAMKKGNDYEKIATFETFFKKTVAFSDEAPSELTIEKALNQKIINAFLLNKVFVKASDLLGLSYEMVFTNNRFQSAFDENFEGYHQLDELLIYYPSVGKYLTPANYYSRIGFPAEQYIGNKGLFVKQTEVAGVITGITKVKTIGVADINESQSVINATITLTGDDMLPKANIEHLFSGYSAYNIQPVYYLFTDQQRKESSENILKTPGEQTVVKDIKEENTDAESILKKPLIIKGNIEMPHLIEKAGNKYLYKIGMIIGPQFELYQEKPRKTNVELGYPHGFVRNIELIIPDGYKISNLKDLNFDVKLTENGKDGAYFVSSYKQEGNKLLITINEQYINTFYPISKYNDYKNVVNAAADFNKVTLIFEKN